MMQICRLAYNLASCTDRNLQILEVDFSQFVSSISSSSAAVVVVVVIIIIVVVVVVEVVLVVVSLSIHWKNFGRQLK